VAAGVDGLAAQGQVAGEGAVGDGEGGAVLVADGAARAAARHGAPAVATDRPVVGERAVGDAGRAVVQDRAAPAAGAADGHVAGERASAHLEGGPDDRDDLWRVLVTLTARKAGRLRRDQGRRKRRVPDQGGDAAPDLEEVIGEEPTPAFAAEVADECRRLLGLLGHPALGRLALLKMEGPTTDEGA